MRLAVPLAIDPEALDGWRQDAPVVELGGETMGTRWQVRLAAPAGFDQAALETAMAQRLEQILAQMSHWRPDSLLGRFNRAAGGTWFTLPRDFVLVLETALSVSESCGGSFDPAIGELVNLWGFGPEPSDGRPTAAALAQARGRSGVSHLAYDPEHGRLRQPGGLQLDFSGIAKGFAVDALGEVLRAHQCRHALVEVGGELLGLGIRPDGDPWWVELETPTHGASPFRVALHQLAVATSGDYVRGRHTIDPRSGHPVAHALAVSVIHSSAMWADAWATALSVEEPAAMEALATREGLAVRALIRCEGHVREWISPALSALLVEPETPGA
ncbi:FAD:protein FMN transferase [Novosphingobium sp. RD2P27]|uniref:FAD:protein FMN transferase n=1 Tax=Novosphingobium kalidii TaxID=3230299 RepID=A0ABV2CZH8_9SPHN